MRDLLLHHRPVDVVHAEVEGDLGDLGPHHDPERLHVPEVVEVDPSHGKSKEIREPRRVSFRNLRVLRMECQGDEGLEPAGTILQIPEPPHMVDAGGERLHVPVEHRRIAAQAGVVDPLHDFEPPVPRDLLRADPVPYLRVEDLRSPSRQASQAGILQLADDLFQGKPCNLGEVVDLHGGERLDVHLREPLPEGPEHPEVEIERKVRVEPADDVQLRGVLVTRLLGPGQDLVQRHGVGEGVLPALAECTELAPVDADVGGVDVPVDDEVHPVAVYPPVGEVRHLPHRMDVPAEEQGKGILLGQPHPCRHLILNGP